MLMQTFVRCGEGVQGRRVLALYLHACFLAILAANFKGNIEQSYIN